MVATYYKQNIINKQNVKIENVSDICLSLIRKGAATVNNLSSFSIF